MIRIDIVTLFPDLFKEPLKVLPYKRAIEKGLAKIQCWDLRNYALDSYGTVDDKPYGGGTGMIMMVEPVYQALVDIYCEYYGIEKASEKTENNSIHSVIERAHADNKVSIISLSPKGNIFNQNIAREYVELEQITLICGRYEDMDARITQYLSTSVISIGNYILSGGETASLAVTEAILRLLPGVLDKDVVRSESFEEGTLEYPQYTRPDNFKGMKVPEVLISGDHKKIEEWRREHRNKVKDTKNDL